MLIANKTTVACMDPSNMTVYKRIPIVQPSFMDSLASVFGLSFPPSIVSVALSPSLEYTAAVLSDHRLRIVDFEGELVQEYVIRDDSIRYMDRICFTPDSKFVSVLEHSPPMDEIVHYGVESESRRIVRSLDMNSIVMTRENVYVYHDDDTNVMDAFGNDIIRVPVETAGLFISVTDSLLVVMGGIDEHAVRVMSLLDGRCLSRIATLFNDIIAHGDTVFTIDSLGILMAVNPVNNSPLWSLKLNSPSACRLIVFDECIVVYTTVTLIFVLMSTGKIVRIVNNPDITAVFCLTNEECPLK
jgi:WD40 repeat protein